MVEVVGYYSNDINATLHEILLDFFTNVIVWSGQDMRIEREVSFLCRESVAISLIGYLEPIDFEIEIWQLFTS